MTKFTERLTQLVEALATQTDHPWTIGADFPAPVAGVRHGIVVVPWHTIPRGLEQWDYTLQVIFKTELQARDDAQKLSNIDYSLELNGLIKKAARNILDLDADNGDRHAALLINGRQNTDEKPGDINVVGTTHLYTAKHAADLVALS